MHSLFLENLGKFHFLLLLCNHTQGKLDDLLSLEVSKILEMYPCGNLKVLKGTNYSKKHKK